MQRPLKVPYKITSKHGEPASGYYGKHLGTDYAVGENTEVFAPVSGVATVGWEDSVGKWVQIVEEGNGRIWRFLHLNRQDVANGHRVREGQRIGLSGSTGTNITGAHLHVDCRKAHTTFAGGFGNYYNVEQLFKDAEKKTPAPAGNPTQVYLPATTPGGTWTLYDDGTYLRKGTSDEKATLRPGYFTGNNPPGITYRGKQIRFWLRDDAGIYAAGITTKDFGKGTIWLRNTDAVIS